jgi:hypothetical protein
VFTYSLLDEKFFVCIIKFQRPQGPHLMVRCILGEELTEVELQKCTLLCIVTINSYPDGADLCYRGVFREIGLISHRRATWAGINSYPDGADLC